MIKKYLLSLESLIAISICIVLHVILSKYNLIIIPPSKEKMSNVEYSHGTFNVEYL